MFIILVSNSTHITFPACSNSLLVKVPNPGPISITKSSSQTSAPFTISLGTESSIKKFCPKLFENLKLYF